MEHLSKKARRRHGKTEAERIELVAQALRRLDETAAVPKSTTKSQRRKMKDLQDELDQLRLGVRTGEQAAAFLLRVRNAVAAVHAASQEQKS